MRLELAKLRNTPGKPFKFAGSESIPTLDWWGEKLPLEGDVKVRALAFYQENRIFITLEVAGRIHRRCSRCLRDLIEEFHHKDFLEVPVEPTELYLELEPLVESGGRLALDPKPLCRPDCKGICPSCGADLNVEGHRPGCEALKPQLDPRLVKLRELLAK